MTLLINLRVSTDFVLIFLLNYEDKCYESELNRLKDMHGTRNTPLHQKKLDCRTNSRFVEFTVERIPLRGAASAWRQ